MYPPPPPPPPPARNPESEYYDNGDYEYEESNGSSSSPFTNPLVTFFAGGCLVFVCISFCALLVAALWIADSSLGLTGGTPIPGSDIGLTFEDPAFATESVVNDDGLKLTIKDVNRNASVEKIPPVQGREVIIVTVELLNAGTKDVTYDERNFKLLNASQAAYQPAVDAIAGALGHGSLPANEGLEGRLVFETVANEADLRLLMEPGKEGKPRYIYLQ